MLVDLGTRVAVTEGTGQTDQMSISKYIYFNGECFLTDLAPNCSISFKY